MRTPHSGLRSRNALSRGVSQRTARLGLHRIANWRLSLWRSTADRAPRIMRNAAVVVWNSISPSRVRDRRRSWRRNSLTPHCSSSCFNCWLTAAVDTPSSAAASVTRPVRATASK